MVEKTYEAYREVWQRLKQELPQWNVTHYMGDFDKAMRKAVRLEFPGVRTYGCYFHFAQALVKRARQEGLGVAIRERGSLVRKLFLSLTALPLLPPGEIASTFDYYSTRAVNSDARFIPFVAYMRAEWLVKVKPLGFSVYRAPEGTRTNNAVESHNAELLRNVNFKEHGPVWDLICEKLFLAPKESWLRLPVPNFFNAFCRHSFQR